MARVKSKFIVKVGFTLNTNIELAMKRERATGIIYLPVTIDIDITIPGAKGFFIRLIIFNKNIIECWR